MALQDTKYQQLVSEATSAGVANLNVKEQDGILYISGEAPSADVKNQLWATYNTIDPDYRSGDLVLDVTVGGAVDGGKVKVVTQESNLNIRKGPGTDQPIVGKAAHGDTITLLSKANEQWWLVKDNDGEEGYAYAQYLEPVS